MMSILRSSGSTITSVPVSCKAMVADFHTGSPVRASSERAAKGECEFAEVALYFGFNLTLKPHSESF